MKSFRLGEVERQVMREDAVPQLSLRARNDLVGLRQFLDIGCSGHQWVVVELHGPDLQHMQNDLGVLGIVLVPAIVQGLSRPGQAHGRDQLQVEPGQAKMVSQGTVIIAGRLKPDPHWQIIASDCLG